MENKSIRESIQLWWRKVFGSSHQEDLNRASYNVWIRRRVEVNPDSSESRIIWTEWEDIGRPKTLKEAEESVASFRKLDPDPDHEYRYTKYFY